MSYTSPSVVKRPNHLTNASRGKVLIIDQPETPVNMETFEDQEVKIRYTPWNPFTVDQKIAITPDYVISVMEPSPSILQTYLANVRAKSGDQGAPSVNPEIIAPDGTQV